MVNRISPNIRLIFVQIFRRISILLRGKACKIVPPASGRIQLMRRSHVKYSIENLHLDIGNYCHVCQSSSDCFSNVV